MPYQPNTNFRDSNGVDLGKKLVTKDYLLSVYGSILDSSTATGLTVTPALWLWGGGAAAYGNLGVNDGINRSTPVTTFAGGNNWKSVSCNNDNTLAIKIDGTLWGWGNNGIGQLGVNSTRPGISTPVTTFAGGNNWQSVAGSTLSSGHTAAIKTDGTLWLWGQNSQGNLGTNEFASQKLTPVTTFLGGVDWKSADCGNGHTAAIKTDGTLWVWGRNSQGQLGLNVTTDRSIPTTTFAGGNNWKQLSCGDFFTAAIKTDGTLWVLGTNTAGQLGINDIINRSTPVTTFLGGNNWKSVSCGFTHTAAIKTDGTLWVWGSNTNGALGNNDFRITSTPVTTFAGGNNWKQVDCGSLSVRAIKTDGTLWVWGTNGSGQLGVNDIISRSTPVTTILGGTNWKSVASGLLHTAAIQSVSGI